MKQSIRSRIGILSRATIIGALLLAGLVIIASRVPVGRSLANLAPVPTTTTDLRPTPNVTPGTFTTPAPPAISPSTPATAVPETPVTPTPTVEPATPEPTPEPTSDISKRIGILAGHWGYDSGAVCPDGLREVDITTDVARRTADQLRSLGYQVDILQEQDPDQARPPLQGYEAAAFISLHADSCDLQASGFKVSRWAFSQMPEIEDRLVDCVYNQYSATTGLPRHDGSITIDMWNYYAFREIGKPTPGAIIEMGFMTGDRWLLAGQPDLAAQGIVNGLLCFLKGPTEN